MRRIAVLDAPSNLGLRPPTATSVPGCAKAPGALRDQGLVPRLSARDAGCVTPPRFDPGDWRPGDGVAHAEQIAWYSRRLADRIGTLLDTGEFPVVLGGDCSILLGSALAVHRRSSGVDGYAGLVYVDGHADFRHPGNASYVGAAAGEDLALATGRGQSDLTDIENRRPYFRDSDVVVLGIRSHDEHRPDLHAAGIAHRAVPQLRAEGAARCAQWARRLLSDCIGYWVHLDVDVLDPAVMPAVDAPDPGGIAYAELELLLSGLVATPHCLGVEITVFDPDYDPNGVYAADLVDSLVAGLAPATGVAALDWGALAPAAPAEAPRVPRQPSAQPLSQPLSRPLTEPLSPPLVPAAVTPVAPRPASVTAEDGVTVTPAPAVDGVTVTPAPAVDGVTVTPAPAADGVIVTPALAVGRPVAVDRSPAVAVEPPAAIAQPTAAAVGPSAASAVAPAAAAEREAAVTESPAAVGKRPAPSGQETTTPRRPLGSAAPRRTGLDRVGFSDMVNADRAALARRRTGGIPLRRRAEAAGEATAAADRDAEPTASGPAGPSVVDPARTFAGLAEQVRAAGSGQVPAARAPVEQPAVPAPPAETA